jgi:simple sugar transport system permease protein
MMVSSLFGSLTAYWSSSWAVGLLVAVVVGILMALLMGFFAFNLKTDIILVGIAVNMVGSGGTLFLVKVITNITEGKALASTTSLITKALQVPSWNIPIIKSIPVLGKILSGHCILTYLAFLLVLITWVLLYKTPLGLNIRSVGENPNAAASVGVSVIQVKYIAIGLSGAMSGFGGAFMSMYYAMGWSQDMVAGRGFIALAAQAMGAGEPLGSMLAAMVFGFAQALGIKISSTGTDSNLVSPIPYLVTILGLVCFALVARWKVKRQHSAAALKEAAK